VGIGHDCALLFEVFENRLRFLNFKGTAKTCPTAFPGSASKERVQSGPRNILSYHQSSSADKDSRWTNGSVHRNPKAGAFSEQVALFRAWIDWPASPQGLAATL
jgi:hypothetical protein